jgi:hypothetical protein
MIRILDHVDQALDRLPEGYRGQPITAALIEAIVTPLQTLEGAAAAVKPWRDLASVEGRPLEVIGRILKVRRNGLSDTDYRARLRAEIAVLHSDGLAESILHITRLTLGIAAGYLRLKSRPPASFYLTVRTPITVSRLLLHTLWKGKLAGVGARVITSRVAVADRLTFASGGGKGFGSVLGSSANAGKSSDIRRVR